MNKNDIISKVVELQELYQKLLDPIDGLKDSEHIICIKNALDNLKELKEILNEC